MLDNAAMTKLIFDLFDLERKKLETGELLNRFGEELKFIFAVEKVETKVIDKIASISPAEDFTINTMKPVIDNRLSAYSSFKEFVDYFNMGYKSCILFPVVSNGKAISVIKLLSKEEEKFDKNITNALTISTIILGYQIAGRTEQEKSVNVAKYFDAAFNSIVPQFLIDANGAIIRANKSMLILFSASSREVIGKNVKDFFQIDANMLASLRKGIIAETRIVGKGDRRFKISSSQINDKMMHITFYETTEMRDLEEKTKILSYSNYEAMLMMDARGTPIWVSDNVDKVLRLQKNSLLGRPFVEMLVEKERIRKGIETMGEGIYTDSAKINIGNGVFQDVRLTFFANKMYGLSCILANNPYESAFGNLEKNFDELVKMSADAIIFIDPLGYIQRVNKSAENIFGYREEELIGGPAAILYTDEEQDKLPRALSLAKQEGTISNIFAKMKGKKEEAFIPCDQSVRSVKDQSGNLAGYIIVNRELKTKYDLDEAQEILEDKEKEIEKLQAESELKSQFIFNISHDIKTPITNIKGFGTILYNEEHGPMNEEQKGYIKIVIDESDRLMDLIKQILDVARLSSGKVKLELQPVDLKKLGDNPSIKAQEEVATGKGLMFSWNVDYNVGEVNIDPNRIIQVFVNLITNAVKFTEHGSIMVNITKKGKNIRVEVKDTGIGISKEDQRKLFKKFYQVHRTELTVQQGSGTGLGLSIVKEIVNLHGGRMGINSELGKGSTFWFTIPISGKKKKPKEPKEASEGKA
ncbi:MAG: PAS domain S-box protein [Candidatus Micrarchaeota archaeon]|nr:PAS domain S-box protein [Candidatus Micrarchaeota archaeon]